VAVAPYFDGKQAGLVGPDGLGWIIARYLAGTDVSIVMLQDGVGKENIPADQVDAYVTPFLRAAADACRVLSRPGGLG
jgi:hypothetical protein